MKKIDIAVDAKKQWMQKLQSSIYTFTDDEQMQLELRNMPNRHYSYPQWLDFVDNTPVVSEFDKNAVSMQRQVISHLRAELIHTYETISGLEDKQKKQNEGWRRWKEEYMYTMNELRKEVTLLYNGRTLRHNEFAKERMELNKTISELRTENEMLKKRIENLDL